VVAGGVGVGAGVSTGAVTGSVTGALGAGETTFCETTLIALWQLLADGDGFITLIAS
jgi:hypothetical protein